MSEWWIHYKVSIAFSWIPLNPADLKDFDFGWWITYENNVAELLC